MKDDIIVRSIVNGINAYRMDNEFDLTRIKMCVDCIVCVHSYKMDPKADIAAILLNETDTYYTTYYTNHARNIFKNEMPLILSKVRKFFFYLIEGRVNHHM